MKNLHLSVPNVLSLLRMGLIPFFIIAVVDHHPARALVIFLAAGLTDALDGFIARFFGQMTVLGAFLDPIADKLLLVSAYVALTIPGLHPGFQIPIWVTVLVIARDVLIVVLALLLFLALGVTSFLPRLLSKVNTAVQIVAVILVLVTGVVPGLEGAAALVIYVVAGLAVLSGLDYILRANQMAANKSHEAA